MDRIIVIGCPGSGKSTLARRLASGTGLPLVHLDRLYWTKGWARPTAADWERKLAALCATDAWIIDGNYLNTLEIRLRYCELAVFLDTARWRCVARVLWRSLSMTGRTRPDMADGCRERLDLTFLADVWRFNKEQRPALLGLLEESNARVIVIKETRDLERADIWEAVVSARPTSNKVA